MTPTATLDQQVSIDRGNTTHPPPKLPSRSEVACAIRADCFARGVECELDTSWEVWCMLESGVAAARRQNGMYHLTAEDLKIHEVLDAIMPDDEQGPIKGSAHDLIHRRLLRSGEQAIIHTKDHSHALKPCGVAIVVAKR